MSIIQPSSPCFFASESSSRLLSCTPNCWRKCKSREQNQTAAVTFGCPPHQPRGCLRPTKTQQWLMEKTFGFRRVAPGRVSCSINGLNSGCKVRLFVIPSSSSPSSSSPSTSSISASTLSSSTSASTSPSSLCFHLGCSFLIRPPFISLLSLLLIFLVIVSHLLC